MYDCFYQSVITVSVFLASCNVWGCFYYTVITILFLVLT